ncbi:hypothetical protein FKW77_007741 [Venturia effusa]|uniref:PLD phosphodiesterase domain-containing protein n=1 Tax=Venturia effusa TaxID=50376 RepID=A0A517L1M8_9PEZI|nr:hypothetical protein FKW77_007741 [Venturia effusa]
MSWTFELDHLDPDVRDLVRIKIVHGSWKREDAQRTRLEESAKRYPNTQIIVAHMPEAFGTHHTKMMVLFRHDDTAQIVIHTANMISQDWANLTQAVWRSSMLPRLADAPATWSSSSPSGPVGSGARFKFDFLRYLKGYGGQRTKSLIDQLRMYDFSSIRAALIGSMPSKDNLAESQPTRQTSWGWPGLKEILSTIPCSQGDSSKQPDVVAQVSSIATLTEKWINNFAEVLGTKKRQSSDSTFGSKAKKPKLRIVFPTAEEVRQSIDGYASGASIHMKIQSPAQQKQLAVMKPMFCRWMGDALETQNNMGQARTPGLNNTEPDKSPKRRALRNTAAPHIKTYIRFSDVEKQDSIDWAMVTSANLSQQAWGALPDKEGAVRICSYELGVVVWPDLFRQQPQEAGEGGGGGGGDGRRESEEVTMVPIFGRDTPDVDGEIHPSHEKPSNENNNPASQGQSSKTIVGFRMPYDLPLVPYTPDDLPWCATASYKALDAFGRSWGA